MKKLALSLAVLFGVAMVSCGGNEKKECADSANCEDTTVVAEEAAVVTDSANDTTVAAAAEVAEVADSAKAEK